MDRIDVKTNAGEDTEWQIEGPAKYEMWTVYRNGWVSAEIRRFRPGVTVSSRPHDDIPREVLIALPLDVRAAIEERLPETRSDLARGDK